MGTCSRQSQRPLFDVSEFNGPRWGRVALPIVFCRSRRRCQLQPPYSATSTSIRRYGGTEIDSTSLRIRRSVTLRVCRSSGSPVQPTRSGIGLFNWRYSETGEFLGANREIFRDQFVASGNRPGAVALGGIRFAGESVSSGFEIRYHKADADLGEFFEGTKIDLGGWVYNFTIGVRFR